MPDVADMPAEVALRDGGVVTLRAMAPTEIDDVRALSDALPLSDRPADLQPPGDARVTSTVVAARGEQLLGYASYHVCRPSVARMSMAVQPSMQRLRLGSLLLQELSARADAAGIVRFTTETSVDNVALLRLLRHSGFPVTFRSRPGRVVIDLQTRLPEPGREQAERREDEAAAAAVAHVLRPASVAVVGASATRRRPVAPCWRTCSRAATPDRCTP